MKRTCRPGASSAGGSRPGSHILVVVRPIRRQPPGDDAGYTALIPPAIAMDPAGTLTLGLGNLGTPASLGSSPVR